MCCYIFHFYDNNLQQFSGELGDREGLIQSFEAEDGWEFRFFHFRKGNSGAR